MSFRANVESMSKIMDEMGLTELELERQFLFGIYRKHIHLSKQQTIVSAPHFAPAQNPGIKIDAAAAAPDNRITLNSPMVGVAYLSPEPGAAPFTKIGAQVNVGDTVALIEAMKTFNPIKSDRAGIVKEFLVSDGAAVEFGQPIIVIE